MATGSSSAATLLEVWAEGRRQPPARQAITVLERIGGEVDADRLPIGNRDRLLLRMLQTQYGPTLEGIATCPECGAAIEIETSIEALTAGASAAAITVCIEDEQLSVRAPSTCDIEAAIICPDPAQRLAELCTGRSRLSADQVEQIGEAILASDPLLDAEMLVTCPSCMTDVALAFDVAAYLWRRIDAGAQAVMRQVHQLARAYGWSEAEILALPEARRAAYIALVTA